jgi:hypothetical protein
MKLATGVAIALAAGAAPPAAPAPRDGACLLHGTRSFARKSDLPRGALAALGFPMAERGAPFQVSDAIGPGPRLPFARFVAARLSACSLTIRYEHGGIAHTFETALLARRGDNWVVVRSR